MDKLISAVRRTASGNSAEELQRCIDEQVDAGTNNCIVLDSTEATMTVLARANYIRSLLAQGLTTRDAFRRLGQQIRRFNTA